jgi:hypothetical protein
MSASSLRTSARAQAQRMQGEIETMVRDTIAPTLAEIVAKASSSAGNGSNQIREYSDTIAVGVRGRPLMSIVALALIGFIAGRVTAAGK